MANNIDKKYLHAERVKSMIQKMINAGISRAEIAEASKCSRWMLDLWLKGKHVPSDESYKNVKAAYFAFRPYALPPIHRIIAKLEDKGVALKDKLNCNDASIDNWRAKRTVPQARFRVKLVELYRKKVAA